MFAAVGALESKVLIQSGKTAQQLNIDLAEEQYVGAQAKLLTACWLHWFYAALDPALQCQQAAHILCANY